VTYLVETPLVKAAKARSCRVQARRAMLDVQVAMQLAFFPSGTPVG
jgi:hypothetical protein